MIVFGDLHASEPIDAIVDRLRRRLDRLLLRIPADACRRRDEVRALCILAGQIEQAARDDLPQRLPPVRAQEWIQRIATVTDLAAATLCTAAARQADQLGRMARAIAELPPLPGVRVTLRVPEGFAFYALFPESYAVAAEHWMADHRHILPGRVLVVGIRSIGTTLSAVAAARLAAADCEVRRLSVRPTGHPFRRRVAIDAREFAAAVAGARHQPLALVVDEGPGFPALPSPRPPRPSLPRGSIGTGSASWSATRARRVLRCRSRHESGGSGRRATPFHPLRCAGTAGLYPRSWPR